MSKSNDKSYRGAQKWLERNGTAGDGAKPLQVSVGTYEKISQDLQNLKTQIREKSKARKEILLTLKRDLKALKLAKKSSSKSSSKSQPEVAAVPEESKKPAAKPSAKTAPPEKDKPQAPAVKGKPQS